MNAHASLTEHPARRVEVATAVTIATGLALAGMRAFHLAGHYGRDLLLDDAFISFRYARNLARGEGLVFNPGERVEGYTNFLWTALLGVLDRLGAPPPAASMALAWLATAGTVVLLALLGRRLLAGAPAAPLLAALPALVFAATGAVGRYVVAGMETPLFVFLLTLALWLEVRSAPAAAIGLTLAAATLTRPEGALFFAVFAAYRLAAGPAGGGRGRLAEALRLFAGFAALAAPFLAWRLAYYGDWLPNAFYVKVGGVPEGALLARGWSHLVQMVRGSSLEAPLVLALFALPAARARRVWLLAWGLIAAAAAFVVAAGGDFLHFFGPRFLLPALPPLLLAAAGGVGWALGRLPPAGRWARGLAAAALLALLANALVWSWPRKPAELGFVAAVGAGWADLGRWLAVHSEPDAVVAIGAVGYVPYYSERRTLDMLGLTDRHIARLDLPLGRGVPGHEKHDTGYVLDRRPDYLVFTRVDPEGVPFLVAWDRWRERIESEYELLALVRTGGPPGPSVLTGEPFTPERWKQGYQMTVYRLRRAAAGP